MRVKYKKKALHSYKIKVKKVAVWKQTATFFTIK